MPQNKNIYAQAIGSAVKAELARSGKSIGSLAPVLGVSSGTVYSRARGYTAFDLVELQLIANYLDIPVVRIVESAQLEKRLSS